MSSKDPKFVKNKLRSEMKVKLRNLSKESKLDSSTHISSKLKQWLSERPEIKVVATFANLAIEPDLSSLLSSMLQIKWAYPHSKPDGMMEFHLVEELSDLEVGLYGILQPKSEPSTLIPPQEIDCYLCPAFAYSDDGSRLGKGGGYYDRLLTKRKADSTLIGVAFKEQLVDELPSEDHDVKVDLVVTG